jgi:hypothetical protein
VTAGQPCEQFSATNFERSSEECHKLNGGSPLAFNKILTSVSHHIVTTFHLTIYCTAKSVSYNDEVRLAPHTPHPAPFDSVYDLNRSTTPQFYYRATKTSRWPRKTSGHNKPLISFDFGVLPSEAERFCLPSVPFAEMRGTTLPGHRSWGIARLIFRSIEPYLDSTISPESLLFLNFKVRWQKTLPSDVFASDIPDETALDSCVRRWCSKSRRKLGKPLAQ